MFSTEEFHEELASKQFKDVTDFSNPVEFSLYMEQFKSDYNIPTYLQTVVLYCEWGTDHTFERVATYLTRKIVGEIAVEASNANLIKGYDDLVDITSFLTPCVNSVE